MSLRHLTMTALGALAATLALGGCDRGNRSDAAARYGDPLNPMSPQARDQKMRNLNDTTLAARNAMQGADPNNTLPDSAQAMDAIITSAVKAELAKDPGLSALNINVDTHAGRVELRGTAPTVAARQRAMALASNLKGVIGVDNVLRVQPTQR